MISRQLLVGQLLPALEQVRASGQVWALLSLLVERGLSLAPGQRTLPAPLPEQLWQRVLRLRGQLEAEAGPAPSLVPGLEMEQPLPEPELAGLAPEQQAGRCMIPGRPTAPADQSRLPR